MRTSNPTLSSHLRALPSFVVATGVCGAFAAATAMAAPATIDPTHSELTFVSRQMGVPVHGRFRRYDAQIDFDPKKPDTGRVRLDIDLASATLGAPEIDAELGKTPWFDVARFPKATFQSTGIKAVGPQRYDVAGKLSLKGAAQDLVVPVTLAPAGGSSSVATGTFTIKRLDFRVGDGDWTDTSMVANDVQVRFRLTLSGPGR